MRQYSYDEIYKRLKVVAKVISLHGETFLPIFERLEQELKLVEQKNKKLDLIRKIAVE